MEMSLLEVKNHLMATDEEFSRLVREHSDYEQQLQALSRRPFLTEAERVQEINPRNIARHIQFWLFPATPDTPLENFDDDYAPPDSQYIV